MSGQDLRLIGALAGVALVAAGAVAAPAAAESGPQGPVHAWGGTLVQSLDPAPLWAHAAQTPVLPLDSGSSPPSSDSPPPPGDSSSPAGSTTPTGSPAEPRPVHRDQVLSNERTRSRWAYTAALSPIYAHPTTRSRRLNRLRWWTEDGFPEVYLLLRSHYDRAGLQWILLRIPMRPNGKVGWVPRTALGGFNFTSKQLVLKRGALRIYLYDKGRRRWSAPVGIGAPGTPTPPGRFWIRERFKILNRGSGYWPYAFGTANYSTLTDWPGGGVVGIHGPYHEPGRIPGRPSHGCIRLHTGADAWLAHHVGVGTPLRIV